LMQTGKVSTWTRRSKTSALTYQELDVRPRRRQVEEWPDHAPVSISKDFTSASNQAHIQVFASYSRLQPLILRIFFWLFMDFRMRILPGVGWIGSPLPRLASSWVLLWYLGLPANNRVLLNPLPRQSMGSQLVVALSSFESHTPWVTLVRSLPMSHFNVTALVP
jgi:hypothetical protein